MLNHHFKNQVITFEDYFGWDISVSQNLVTFEKSRRSISGGFSIFKRSKF